MKAVGVSTSNVIRYTEAPPPVSTGLVSTRAAPLPSSSEDEKLEVWLAWKFGSGANGNGATAVTSASKTANAELGDCDTLTTPPNGLFTDALMPRPSLTPMKLACAAGASSIATAAAST